MENRFKLFFARAILILAACLFGQVAHGQPFIAAHGVLNAASFAPPGLPTGSIAQGSLFIILGSGLEPTTPVQALAAPLNTSLAGVSVQVFRGTQSVSALPVSVSASQILAVMPSGADIQVCGIVNGQAVLLSGRKNVIVRCWLAEAHVQLIQRQKELLAVRFADPAAAEPHENAVPDFVRPEPGRYSIHNRRRNGLQNRLV